MDRLLSDDEMVAILDNAPKPCPMEFKDEPKVRAIASAQLANADRWWVERIENIKNTCHSTRGNCGYLHCANYHETCFTADCRWWQEFLQEIGL